ncbi:MAG: tetratricopeptide repeat protein [Gemmataceae bacterium]
MTVPDWLAIVREAEKLFDNNQFAEAFELAQKALSLNPDCALAHQVIGLCYARQDRVSEAMPALQHALSLRPDLPPSHNDLGMCYYKLDDLDRAIYHYEVALTLQPDHAFAHFNRALAWLKQGNCSQGWVEYEWRWHTGQVARPEIPRPRWDGGPLQNRSILVHTEQGAGDVIQFIRFLPRLKELGARVVLACQTNLQGLLREIEGVDEWFPIDQQADINFDLYIPMMSLASALKLTVETLPTKSPYLFAQRSRVDDWRDKLGTITDFRVGICWQGSPTFRGDNFRSVALTELLPLASVPEVQLVSLQMIHGTDQLASWSGPPILDFVSGIDPKVGFEELAALMTQLDLIITCDTAVAHLAGALGRPVWVLLPTGSDWRWLDGRNDSPWYPTAQLFRQKGPGGWPPLIEEVLTALERAVWSQHGHP